MIRKLRLQNIKSYHDRELTFHEGVNFISGLNGAGKSTLIEAIGYAIFDYNPYPNAKDFIRYGAKSGAITVDFCANDERDYRVLRKIGPSTLWAVYDLENDESLDLHGAKDVKEWLKEAMGLDRDIDSNQLFQDVIGVPQGTFVGPFLETLAIRKKKFDAILKVEQYRDAFNNTAKALSELRSHIKDKDTNHRIMAEQVKEYDNLLREIKELLNIVQELNQKLAQQKELIKNKETEVANLEKMRNQLEKTTGEINTLEVKVNTLEERQKDISNNLKKANSAAQQVKSAEAGFNGYLKVEEELKALEEKRVHKEQLEKNYNQNKQEITKISTQVREKEKMLEKQFLEITANKEKTAAQKENLHIQRADAKALLDNSVSKKSHQDKWQKKEDDLFRLINQLNDFRQAFQSKEDLLDNLHTEQKELEKRLANMSEIEKEAATFQEKKQSYENAQNEYQALKNQLKIHHDNLNQAEEGKCPFLDSPCMDLQNKIDFFSHQIEQTKKEMDKLTIQGQHISKELASASSARDRLIELQSYHERLNKINQQKETLINEINHLFDKCTGLPIDNTILSLSATANLPLLKATEITSSIQKLKSLIEFNLKKTIFDTILSALEEYLNESKTHKTHLEKSLSEEIKSNSNLYTRLETEFNNVQINLADLINKENKINQDKNNLTAEKEKSRQLEEKAQHYSEQLAQFAELNEQIIKARKQQNEYRRDYDLYNQNIVEAGKIQFLEKEVHNLSHDMAENKNKIIELKTLKDSLSDTFNPSDFAEKRNDLEKIKQETAVNQQILKERSNDLKTGQEKVLEIEKIIKKMDKLRLEIIDDQRNLSLLEIIRNILNSAGSPIAKIYLENLSREANDLYRQVSCENVALEWRENYDIVLIDNFNSQKRERSFKQFSGGEQMTAALAVRLALLKQSRVKVGFFDEPTANLDANRRINLAETIPRVTRGFDQIFIISHDDTFDEITENVIQLQKDDGNGTELL